MAQREPYGLGIDAGTTFTAAAVATARGAEIVTLGGRIDTVPSAIYVPGEGPDVIGEAAVRRAVTEPARVARWFKRRIGDPTPLVIGGRPYPAEALTAKLLRWAVEQASAERGGPPGAVAVTHPANWGPFKLDVFAQALTIAELRGATLLPEPVAAARYYATSERLSPGDVVAVYDLGGGTFDATVLRATAGGFDILGEPEGLEHLGGLDFDQAVFGFVLTAIGTTADALDLNDPATAGAVARLRQECTEAKEALSSDSDVRIPVLLPGVQRDVRLTRGELESMMEPAIETSIGALRRAITSARVEPEAVEAILLVGGASRTPLVAQMLSASFGRRIALDAHPKHAVALGAALAAAEALGARGPAVEPPRAEAEIAEAGAETEPAEAGGAEPAGAAQPSGDATPRAAEIRAPSPPPRSTKRRGLAVAIAAVVVAAAVGAYVLVSKGGDGSSAGPPPGHDGTTSPTGGSTPSATSGGGAELTWTRLPARDAPRGPGQQEMNKVVAAGPGLVAVGTDAGPAGPHGAIWTSSAGSSWVRAGPTSAFPSFQHAEIFGVAATQAGLVAGGYQGDGSDLNAALWTSSNGTVWTAVADPTGALGLSGPGQQVVNRVAAVGSGAVAVGYDGPAAAVWLYDATAWTRVPDRGAFHAGGASYRMRDVVSRGSTLVAVGYVRTGASRRPAVWTSVDAGHAWTLVEGAGAPTGSGGLGFASIALGGPGFVAVGASGDGSQQRAAVWTSADGTSWTDAERVSAAGTGPQGMNMVLADGDRLVAVGSAGTGAAAWTSADGGTTWSVTAGGAELGGDGVARVMRGAAVLGSGIVAVGWSDRGGGTDATVWTAS